AHSHQLAESSLISVSQSLITPNPDRPLTEVNAYTTRVGEAGSGEVYALGNDFTYLPPFSYNIREDGSLTQLRETPVLAAARATQVDPLLVLTNFRNGGFSSDLVAAVLR